MCEEGLSDELCWAVCLFGGDSVRVEPAQLPADACSYIIKHVFVLSFFLSRVHVHLSLPP